jgi:hypothetical protein
VNIHELKCWPEFYWAMWGGDKEFDIRSEADRTFAEGDLLAIRFWAPEKAEGRLPTEAEDENLEVFTPDLLLFEVTYCMRVQPWVPEGYVAMGLRRVKLST